MAQAEPKAIVNFTVQSYSVHAVQRDVHARSTAARAHAPARRVCEGYRRGQSVPIIQ